jgi:hypothetical protein
MRRSRRWRKAASSSKSAAGPELLLAAYAGLIALANPSRKPPRWHCWTTIRISWPRRSRSSFVESCDRRAAVDHQTIERWHLPFRSIERLDLQRECDRRRLSHDCLELHLGIARRPSLALFRPSALHLLEQRVARNIDGVSLGEEHVLTRLGRLGFGSVIHEQSDLRVDSLDRADAHGLFARVTRRLACIAAGRRCGALDLQLLSGLDADREVRRQVDVSAPTQLPDAGGCRRAPARIRRIVCAGINGCV